MNTVTYFVPLVPAPELASDYNPQIYASGTPKQPGWITAEEFAAAFPLPVPPPPGIEEQVEAFMSAIQLHLDNFARSRGYDSILSATSYATDPNPDYAAEGQYCVEARSATWAWSNDYLNKVLSGQQPIPAWARFEAALEAAVPLVWPVPDTRAGV